MSLTLITGIPGAGKTLFAVSRLKKEIEKNMSLSADEQIKIYSDITGLNIEGVELPPIDWRETPPKSLLVYDEAQFHKEFKPSRGVSPYDFIEELTIHRKTGHQIWYITQDPKRLHSNILEMVEQHYHLERPYGAKLATIYQFRGAERSPKSRSAKERAERQLLFNYDKSLFKYYQSSQVEDGIKLRLPKKITAYLLLLLGLIYFIVSTFFFDEDMQETKRKLAGQETSEEVQPLSNNLAPQDISENIQKEIEKTAETEQPIQDFIQPLDEQTQAEIQAINHQSEQQLFQDFQSIEQQPIQLEQQFVSFEQKERERPATVVIMNNECIAQNVYGHYLDLTLEECKQVLDRPLELTYLKN